MIDDFQESLSNSNLNIRIVKIEKDISYIQENIAGMKDEMKESNKILKDQMEKMNSQLADLIKTMDKKTENRIDILEAKVTKLWYGVAFALIGGGGLGVSFEKLFN